MVRVIKYVFILLVPVWALSVAAQSYSWPPISSDTPLGVMAVEVRGDRLVVRRGEARANRRPIPKVIRLAENIRIEGLRGGRSLRTTLPAFVEILGVAPGSSQAETIVTHLRVRAALDKDAIGDLSKP